MIRPDGPVYKEVFWMEQNTEWKGILIGVILIAASAVFIPVFIKKATGITYRHWTRPAEKDFINNGPVEVRKTEEAVNDD